VTATWGVTGLSLRYGRRTALDGVSLEVPAGAITAVIGGDGAGKTSLLRCLAGVVRPTAGTVRRPQRRRIGYVAGTSGVYADLSVAENIAFVAGAYDVRGPVLAARTRDLLAHTGLEGTGERLAGRLSGGMRQKLAFALAMLHAPDLLILDEPTTGVDPVSRADLWRLIAAAAAGGAGVVVTTTYLDEAQRASGVLLLDAGRAGAAGPPEAVAAALPPAAPRPQHDDVLPPTVAQRAAEIPQASARDVVRRFGRLTAVAGVDAEVRAGEVVGLLGANGAGKTTLIRLLLGLLRPTSGVIRLFGEAPSRAGRLRLGYVPQGLGLWEDLSVAENLAFSAQAFGTGVPGLDPELEAERDSLVRELPLGLRRRLAFAVALAHHPELLVLDEPTSGVDPAARARLWESIHGAALDGAGVLVTTHHLDEAAYCDRLVVMAAGSVVAQGTMAGIVGDRRAVAVEAPRWEAAFASLDSAGLPAALVGRTLRVPGGDAARVRAALDAGGTAATLSVVPATFEETFVALARAIEPSPAPTASHSPTGRTAP
jgi:ABC-2 type transport system ATP-binding protein